MTRAAVLPIVFVLAAVPARAGAQDARIHTGTVVDAITGKPVAADVAAYAARDLGATGDCPQHREPIDRRTADAAGAFEIRVDAKYESFVAVYCADGYVAREQLANRNQDSGSRVVPDPVKLYPTAARLKNDNTPPTDALRLAVINVIQEVTEQVSLFAAGERIAVQQRFAELLPPDQQLVAVLARRAGRSRPSEAAVATTAPGALTGVLDSATMHLRYFASATGSGFFAGLKAFRGEDREIVEILRNRALTGTLRVP